MFQSVTPRPGKVSIQLEPFPVPPLQLLPEASPLQIDEPVAVIVPAVVESDLGGEKDAMVLESPFMMASEVAGELGPRKMTPLAELVSTLMAEEDGPEDDSGEVVPPPLDDYPEPFAFTPGELEEVENGVEVFSEIVEPIEAMTEPEPAVIASPFETTSVASKPVCEILQPPAEVEVEVLEPASPHSSVQTWQPPTNNKSKKNARFGAFFR